MARTFTMVTLYTPRKKKVKPNQSHCDKTFCLNRRVSYPTSTYHRHATDSSPPASSPSSPWQPGGRRGDALPATLYSFGWRRKDSSVCDLAPMLMNPQLHQLGRRGRLRLNFFNITCLTEQPSNELRGMGSEYKRDREKGTIEIS